MPPPSLLLFDLGGVLLENHVFDRLAALLPDPPPLAELKPRWLASDAVRNFESGLTTEAGFAASFLAEWRLDLSPQDFIAEFLAWPSGYFPGVPSLLRRLRQDFRVACFSNSNPLHWHKFDGFAADFDLALSSHLLGAVKPDREAFRRAIAACGRAPAEIAFFDDAAANVATARDMGLQAFQVDGPHAVVARLRAEAWWSGDAGLD